MYVSYTAGAAVAPSGLFVLFALLLRSESLGRLPAAVAACVVHGPPALERLNTAAPGRGKSDTTNGARWSCGGVQTRGRRYDGGLERL